MTAAFLVIYLVSKMDNSKQAQLERSLYPAQKVRSETGVRLFLGIGSLCQHGHPHTAMRVVEGCRPTGVGLGV
jgi:lactam utilization protein B